MLVVLDLCALSCHACACPCPQINLKVFISSICRKVSAHLAHQRGQRAMMSCPTLFLALLTIVHICMLCHSFSFTYTLHFLLQFSIRWSCGIYLNPSTSMLSHVCALAQVTVTDSALPCASFAGSYNSSLLCTPSEHALFVFDMVLRWI
jgi:hypothetical protein